MLLGDLAQALDPHRRFAGEAVAGAFGLDQRGGSDVVKNDADAWTVEGGWTFADLPWSPTLNYRHARFSADKAGTARNEAFDPLFFGLSRGLGTWFQGEVAANYAGRRGPGQTIATTTGDSRNQVTAVGVEAAGVAEVILYFNYGQKPHAMVKEQMQRFMLEVAPHFA